MLMLSLFTYMVYLAYNSYNSTHLNRVAGMSTLFCMYLAWDSLSMQYSNMSLFNNWFSYDAGNSSMVTLLLTLVLTLIMYGTMTTRYTLNNPWMATLMLVNLMGLVLFPMVNDLMPLYVMMELQSYSLYLLTGVYNKSYNATRAAMTYFVTGGVASVLMLLSSAEVYQMSGLTNLTELTTYFHYNNNGSFNVLDMTLMGLVFKMGLAPLHAWSMAVYSYTPTYMTAYMSMVAKVSIMAFMYLHMALFNTQTLLTVFYLSMAMAAYTPLYQVTLKSMLAYSGMLNFGYTTTSVMLGDEMFYMYMMQYSLTHMLMFYAMLAMSEYTATPSSQWSPMVNVNQLMVPNKTLALLFIMALFSLIGMPPLPGFYGKYYVMTALMHNGLYMEGMAIMMFSVMATYYYAYMIKQLATNLTLSFKPLNGTLSLMLSIYGMLIMSFFMALPYTLQGYSMMAL
uniref:NADH-ubiquinone oxidoreductase chain 2 n=1 Tax=Candida prachuapensis TaxID=536035 RepID=U3MH89_9ASCO|nr:NADH dehydrogenase subunit 2 [Candida prachuapensis]AGW07366.1 NADH dehydrogenase subunit 2 [Candida prachuapensis]